MAYCSTLTQPGRQWRTSILLNVCLLCVIILAFNIQWSGKIAKILRNHTFDTLHGAASQSRVHYRDEMTPPDSENGCSADYPTETVSQPELIYHQDNSSFIPKHVYYIWCGVQRQFTFSHYLSAKSMIHLLRPDPLKFYYQSVPIVDNAGYNTWFEDLKNEYLFFNPIQMTEEQVQKACGNNALPKLSFIIETLNETGGIYVHEDTILMKADSKILSKDIVVGRSSSRSTTDFMMMKPKVLPINGKKGTQSPKEFNVTCSNMSPSGHTYTNDSICVIESKLYPKDIWERDDKFGRFARLVLFDRSGRIFPVKTPTALAPNIAHMIWMGGEMSFLFYLGVLSTIFIGKMDEIYIYGPEPPSGKYWQAVKKYTNVHFVYRYQSDIVYGKGIKREDVKDVSDVWRLEALRMYGGLYLDTDAVMVRPFDEEIRSYDAVASYDWINWYPPFPDVINNGVLLGKPGAKFWHLFEEGMKLYDPKKTLWANIRVPYKIKERHPCLLKMDPHFQVICYRECCHPTWWKGYHNGSQNHLTYGRPLDWKNEAYVFHMTADPPRELNDEKRLFEVESIFSDIGKYILSKAGLLDKMKQEHAP